MVEIRQVKLIHEDILVHLLQNQFVLESEPMTTTKKMIRLPEEAVARSIGDDGDGWSTIDSYTDYDKGTFWLKSYYLKPLTLYWVCIMCESV